MKQSPLITVLIVLCVILFVMFSLATVLVERVHGQSYEGGDVDTALLDATSDAQHNLDISTSTYLGGSDADEIHAVDVAPDGSIVLGGVIPGYELEGVTPVSLLGGGSGAILRTNGTGHSVLSLTHIGARVLDLETNDSGRIAACGDFGVALLAADAASVEWSDQPGTGRRCAIDAEGAVAVLVDNEIFVYGQAGTNPTHWLVSGDGVHDVAMHSTHQLVIATGYTQATDKLQVAYIRAWDYAGTPVWAAYDFLPIAGLTADTRGERVAIGRDGLLYFAATVHGGTGASIFTRDPLDANRSSGDRTVLYDRFNNPYDAGTITMTWYGRYDPQTGALLRGQSLLTRLSDGRGNSITPTAIMADEDGRVYVTGSKDADLENRTQRRVGGHEVGNYESGEGFLLVVSTDFTRRLVWTPFARSGYTAGQSPATGVSVRSGTAAIALTQTNSQSDGQGRRLITHNQPLHEEPGGGSSDGFLAVWPLRDFRIAPGIAPGEIRVSTSQATVGTNVFVAEVLPVTVERPLTFTWSVDGVVLQVTTDTNKTSDEFVYFWPGFSGSQELTVAVSNRLGTISATYTFDGFAGKRVYLPVIQN